MGKSAAKGRRGNIGKMLGNSTMPGEWSPSIESLVDISIKAPVINVVTAWDFSLLGRIWKNRSFGYCNNTT